MGNGLTQLSKQQIQKLKDTTPFVEEDMIKLLKRYAKFDDSPKGTVGVKYNLMLTFPELQSNPVIPRLLELYIDPRSRTLYAENFVYFFALLSTKTTISKKREAAWDCFDLNKGGDLSHQELYLMYKLLYNMGLSEDQILSLVHHTLSQPSLSQPGVLNKQEFNEMVTDWDITNFFNVDLQQI